MMCRPYRACGLALALFVTALPAPARAFEARNDQFPNSIMAPEPGAAAAHRVTPSRQRAAASRRGGSTAARAGHRGVLARGSSDFVGPTPLPRTLLIPPEHVSAPAVRAAPAEQGPSIIPSAPALGPIPNLPHGNETFQDRAARCAFQQGLYGVPGTAASQYIGSCVQ
jgi:hypothetical protein